MSKIKFWKKLVLFIVTTISIVLSFSRYYIVKDNFINSISIIAEKNTNQHILEKYMLESDIVRIIQEGEEVTDDKIIDSLKSVYTYTKKELELIALYNEQYEQIYSNMDNMEFLDIEPILNKNTDIYCIRELQGKHYMLFSSHWNINNKIIYTVNLYDIEDIFAERDRQNKNILLTDIVILIIATIGIFIFSIFLTKPIDSLNKTSKKIASGQFNERVKVSGRDEIGELAESFNVMAEQVENKIDELNLQVKRKNDFINGFTHELKTPMTAIIGYADILRLKKCDEELSQKALNYIYYETKRLEKLSFKLMTLMSLNEEKIEMKNINIVSLVENIAKTERNILKKNILKVDIKNSIVKGDSELLEIVIRNLIENANNAEPKDNQIVVKGESIENKKYRISIIDKGKGIPKQHIDRVTDDFYMVDKSRKSGGSGIGLSLVKRILELHKSDIHIASIENEGTTVYFDLEEDEE